MITEVSRNHRTAKTMLQIARQLTGRGEVRKSQRSLLAPIIRKLQAR
jgi:pilus assembly protein CpaE